MKEVVQGQALLCSRLDKYHEQIDILVVLEIPYKGFEKISILFEYG